MRPFALEHDNLRAALAWALDRDARAGLRLAVGLGFGWALAHLAPDVGEWLDRLLYRVPERDDLRAWGLLCSATARRMCGAIEAARDHLEACGAYFRETGNRLGIAWSADGYGLIAAAEGEPARARAWFETSLAAFRELVYPWPGAALRNVALCAMRQGDDARAARRSRRPWPSPVARRMRGRPGAP